MAGIKTTLVVIGFFLFPLVMAQEVVNNAYGVCPVPMNKEEEEMIKEQERNKEEMQEIMREIEITCLDECKTGQHNCHDDAYCTNTKRSFTCTCKPGYFGDGVNCADINECETEEHNCDADAKYVNTVGSFRCTCKLAGFIWNGTSCTDVNECMPHSGRYICHVHATCSNTVGSFICTCKSGYSGNGFRCTEIDECATGKHNCNGSTTCRNTKGSFLCLNCTATPPPPTTTPTTTPGCPEGWVEQGTHCYLNIKKKSTWNQGEEECLKLCASLPVIKSAAENDFLLSLMENEPWFVWLGMESGNLDNVFQWVDGTQVAGGFSAWAQGEPNFPGEENCGHMYTTGLSKGKWNNFACWLNSSLVCQKKK